MARVRGAYKNICNPFAASPNADLILWELAAASRRGVMRFCPPAGPDFTYAYQMSCGSWSKRRKRAATTAIEYTEEHRMPTLEEFAWLCCRFGCTIHDIRYYC